MSDVTKEEIEQAITDVLDPPILPKIFFGEPTPEEAALRVKYLAVLRLAREAITRREQMAELFALAEKFESCDRSTGYYGDPGADATERCGERLREVLERITAHEPKE